MDGRNVLLFGLAFALSAVGCVPSNNKLIDQQSVPAPETVETKSTSLFGRKEEKREPKVELALAKWREQQAFQMKDQPELQFKELNESRMIYQEVLKYDPKSLEAWRGQGRVYVALADFDRASASYKKALELHPREATLYAEYSIVYSKRNDFAQSIKLLDKALELDPENQEFLRMIGVNLVCAGQEERGIQMLARARGKASAHYYVARLYLRLNQPEQARRQLALSIETNPNLSEARTLFAELNVPNNNAAPAAVNVSAPPRQGLDVELISHTSSK